MKTQRILNECTVILLIGAFAYPGLDKLLERRTFKGQLDFSPFLPTWSTSLLSWAIPITMIAISGMLCVKPLRKWALRTYLGLSFFFTLYIIAILTISSYEPCSCIGFTENITWKWQLVFNISLSAISGGLLMRKPSWKLIIRSPFKRQLSQ